MIKNIINLKFVENIDKCKEQVLQYKLLQVIEIKM